MKFSKCCEFQSTLILQRRIKAYPNKISKISQFVVKSDLEPKCKRFSKSATRENLQFETWPTDQKNSTRTAVHQYSPTQRSKSEVYANSFVCLKKVLAPASRLVRIWKFSSFSKSQQAKNTFPAPRGTPTTSCIERFFLYFKKQLLRDTE